MLFLRFLHLAKVPRSLNKTVTICALQITELSTHHSLLTAHRSPET